MLDIDGCDVMIEVSLQTGGLFVREGSFFGKII